MKPFTYLKVAVGREEVRREVMHIECVPFAAMRWRPRERCWLSHLDPNRSQYQSTAGVVDQSP